MTPKLELLHKNTLAALLGARDEEGEVYYVIHPLDDEPEEKCNPETLGPMKLSRAERAVLVALQGYIVAMVCLAAYRVADLAGLLQHILR